MAWRKPSRPATSELSDDPADKVLAALSGMVAKEVAGHSRAPLYFDACREWYDSLSCEQRETVLRVVEAYTCWGEKAAARIAADLPPAPRCPL
jgi:hypothetical protein